MKQTINQVTSTIETWCDSHASIKSFSTKLPKDLNDIKYPLFMMRPTKLGFNNGSVKQTFAIVISDRLMDDNSNENVVFSDMAMIVEDFYIQFFDNDEDYDFELSELTDPTPIVDSQPNKIGGWIFYVTIEVGSTRNEYAIPKV